MLKATLFWIVVFIVFVMGIKGFFLLMNSVSDDIQVSNKTQQQIQSSPTITESPLNLGHKKIELEGLIQEGVRLRNILITLQLEQILCTDKPPYLIERETADIVFDKLSNLSKRLSEDYGVYNPEANKIQSCFSLTMDYITCSKEACSPEYLTTCKSFQLEAEQNCYYDLTAMENLEFKISFPYYKEQVLVVMATQPGESGKSGNYTNMKLRAVNTSQISP